MDSLLLLRGLTLLARLALLVVLLLLLYLAARNARLSMVRRRAWTLIAWVHGIFLLNTALVEAMHLISPDDPARRMLLRQLYNFLYLLNSVLDAVLPLVLLILFLGDNRNRIWPLLGVAAVTVVGAAGIGLGGIQEWGVLLNVAQVLTFAAVTVYLVLFGLYLLRWIPEVDFYLAVFLVVDLIFLVLLPIQEVFFGLVGAPTAAEIWHLHQLLQLAATSVQVAIVLSCVNSIRFRPATPHLRVPL